MHDPRARPAMRGYRRLHSPVPIGHPSAFHRHNDANGALKIQPRRGNNNGSTYHTVVQEVSDGTLAGSDY